MGRFGIKPFGTPDKSGGIKDTFGMSPNMELQYNRADNTQEVCYYTIDTNGEKINYGNKFTTELTGSPEATIGGTFKRASTDRSILFSKYGSGGTNLGWYAEIQADNKIRVIWSSTGTGVWRSVITDNTFTDTTNDYRIVVVMDWTESSILDVVKVYVNGYLETTTAPIGSTKLTIHASTADLIFGGQESSGNAFKGDVKDFFVRDEVWTQSDINTDYNNGNIPTQSPTNLLLHSTFENDDWDGINSRWNVIDDSGNGNDGVTENLGESDRTCENILIKKNLVDDGNWWNSALYSTHSDYEKRSTNSEIKFNYARTYLALIAEVVGTTSETTILVDGAFNQKVTLVNNKLSILTLPSGTKEVTVVQSRVGNNTLDGSFLKNVIVEGGVNAKSQGSVSERIVFLGDSITQGVSATNSAVAGYAQLFKFTDSKNCTFLGYGGATLTELGDTNLATTRSWVTTAFADTTTTKKLVIMLGTNDFAASTAAATVDTNYKALIDAINTDDSDIDIFVITPTIRTDDAALLDTYRADQVTMCSTRAFATSIDGKTILTVGELSDVVHPDTSGHLLIHDDIDGVIL